MPGVKFESVRREIPIEQVLNLLGFGPLQRSAVQWYGRCPSHESRPGRYRYFSVNVALGRYFCHGCRSQDNQLELWAEATNPPLYQAALDLCHWLGHDLPWIRRW
jgi:hypothetical protein